MTDQSLGRWVVAGMAGFLVLVLALAVFALKVEVSDGLDDYADLVPAPDTIVWEQGDETALWLQTNRNGVELRINSVALGVGNIELAFPEATSAMRLGRGEGCLSWVVSSLYATQVNDTGYTLVFDISRNGFTGDATVYTRARPADGTFGATFPTVISSVNSSGSRTASAAAGEWTIEASNDSDFPEATTRRISITVGTDPGATRDDEVETLTLYKGMGVGLVACSPANDVVLTLHGDDGEELNRYLVDIHADSPAAAAHPDAGHAVRRLCLDSADHQVNYLDGGEEAGEAFARDAFGLAYNVDSLVLADTSADTEYRYFFSYSLSGGGVQLLVSDVGASGLGLDAHKVYPVRMTATDEGDPTADTPVAPTTASLDVGVWLDITTLSPGDDGICS